MKNALNNQVGMFGDMFLWLVANLKQRVIYFIKQALPQTFQPGVEFSVVIFHSLSLTELERSSNHKPVSLWDLWMVVCSVNDRMYEI